MKTRSSFLFPCLVAILIFGCQKVPKQCDENISSSPQAGLEAWNLIEQLQADTLLRLIVPKNLSALEKQRIGQLLAAHNTGDKASDRQVDDFYLKEEVQKIHALTTQDKRFFFSYNTEEDQELHMIQISIEWRVGEQTSNTQKFQITKTGYFNANGELVCFWVRTPKI